VQRHPVVFVGAWIMGDWITGDGAIRRWHPGAAAVAYAVHWLAAEHVRGGIPLGYALVGILTAGYALLAARTITGLIRGTFLPRVPMADQAPG
jgi:hypothetical protein